jgi:hypothetical protein
VRLEYDGPTGSGVLKTGPLKIGDDWTGVFIRGDEALTKADLLEMLAREHNLPHEKGSFLWRLIELLRSCREVQDSPRG